MAIRGGKQRLVGVVKEVAPTKQAANDTVLGVGEFSSKYFKGGDLYLDGDRAFYGYLGNKKLLTVGGTLKALALPWRTWKALKAVGARMKRLPARPGPRRAPRSAPRGPTTETSARVEGW